MTETRAPYRATLPGPYRVRRVASDQVEVYISMNGIELTFALCVRFAYAAAIARAMNLVAVIAEIAGVMPEGEATPAPAERVIPKRPKPNVMEV